MIQCCIRLHHVSFLFAAEARSDGATAAIAGGVVGGLVGVALVAVIAILIVIILKNKQDSSQYSRPISLYPYTVQ